MTRDHRHTTSATLSSGSGCPQLLRADELDPESRVLLKVMNLMQRKPLNEDNLARERSAWRLVTRVLGRAETVSRVEALRIPGPAGEIELRLYRPAGRGQQVQPLPAVLWIHGGGFLLGGLATADAICRHLAHSSGAVVVAVRYRLAPEHDLYAGREDCLAALNWMALEGQSVGIDTTQLAIAGDSAGGNLAAAVAQRYHEHGGTALRLQVLVYPATNLRDDFASRVENASGYMLTSKGIEAIQALIFKEGPDLSDPWISPAFRTDLRGLPPAVMVLAGFDPIRDDGLVYAQKLREAGVPVELLHYAGQFHGFLNFNGVLRAARDALDRVGNALRQALHAPAGQAPLTDRTIELSVRTPNGAAWGGTCMGRDMMLLSLMLGERLESWRASSIRSVLPGLGAVASVSPLLYPLTAWRALLGREWAPIDARETYRDGFCVPS